MTLEEKIFYERLEAKDEGREEGKIEGKMDSIFELLEEIGVVSDELRESVSKENDLDKIRKWLKLAAKVESIEEFVEKMKETP